MKLYIVGTPIGNLDDLSLRAVDTLRGAHFIAAEDTRVTLKLLNRFEIKKPLVSYYEHNKNYKGDVIISRILAGESCALVTDAGMPAISDPGEDLVRMAKENGIQIEVIPGPTAFASALSISGMPSKRFCFEGFLSMNKKIRREHLEELAVEKRTMIFYEAPHKLLSTLIDMQNTFGNREICIAREITKLHEEVINTTLCEAIKLYSEKPPKGEIVLIVKGAEKESKQFSLENALDIAKNYISEGIKISDAAKKAASETGFTKSEIYKKLL